jgi:hypothetical protein
MSYGDVVELKDEGRRLMARSYTSSLRPHTLVA